MIRNKSIENFKNGALGGTNKSVYKGTTTLNDFKLKTKGFNASSNSLLNGVRNTKGQVSNYTNLAKDSINNVRGGIRAGTETIKEGVNTIKDIKNFAKSAMDINGKNGLLGQAKTYIGGEIQGIKDEVNGAIADIKSLFGEEEPIVPTDELKAKPFALQYNETLKNEKIKNKGVSISQRLNHDSSYNTINKAVDADLRLTGDLARISNDEYEDKILNIKKEIKKNKESQRNNISGYPTIKQFYEFIKSGDKGRSKIVLTYQFHIGMSFTPSNSNIAKYWESTKYELLVQDIKVPNLMVEPHGETIKNEHGKVIMPSKFGVTPDSNNLSMIFLNTEYGIHETMLTEWLKETSSNTYVYPEHRYTTATIYIQFFDQEHNNIVFEYKFHDAYPTVVDTINPSYIKSPELMKAVTFNFTWMELNVDEKQLTRNSK